MKNKITTGIFILTLVAIVAVGSVAAFGFGSFRSTGEDKTENDAFMEKMQTTIENNDYGAWKTLMEEQITQMQAQITEENFAKAQERHNQMSQVRDLRDQLKTAIENKDTETAENLRTQMKELMPESQGMGKGNGQGIGMRGGEFGKGLNCAQNSLT